MKVFGYHKEGELIKDMHVPKMEIPAKYGAVENKKTRKTECVDNFKMAKYRKTAFSMMSSDVEKLSTKFDKELIDLMRDSLGLILIVLLVITNTKYKSKQ